MPRAYGSDPGRPTAPGADSPEWTALIRQIEGCVRCPLHATRDRVVIYRGAPHPRVLFVGEAPGREEDRIGLPFVGAGGRRLDHGIAELGLGAEEWGVLNLLKCRPPENRFDAGAAATCRPHLDAQIALLEPEIFVTLGRHALQSLDPGAPKITEAAGTIRSCRGRPLVPLLHPAAALHAPQLRARWEDDLRRLGEFLAGPGQTL